MTMTCSRLPGLAALPLLAVSWATGVSAQESPRYTYFGVGYQWTDVNAAVRADGAEHDGITLELSVGLFETGRFGVHFLAGFFDGDFDGGEFDSADSRSWQVGAGVSYGITESVDLVGQAYYVNAELENDDDSGYMVEGLIRAALSEKVELEGGYRYTDIGGSSDIGNSDVLLGLGYHITPWLTLRARGIIFDNDSGLELGVRWNFGNHLGRDFLF